MHDAQIASARAANVALQEELEEVREELVSVKTSLNNNMNDDDEQ